EPDVPQALPMVHHEYAAARRRHGVELRVSQLPELQSAAGSRAGIWNAELLRGLAKRIVNKGSAPRRARFQPDAGKVKVDLRSRVVAALLVHAELRDGIDHGGFGEEIRRVVGHGSEHAPARAASPNLGVPVYLGVLLTA